MTEGAAAGQTLGLGVAVVGVVAIAGSVAAGRHSKAHFFFAHFLLVVGTIFSAFAAVVVPSSGSALVDAGPLPGPI